MPGSRLGYEDRARIAEGLADGIGFAEIARRLGRPTSTVSREVERGGGRAAYRADGAHRAARGRARRLAPADTPLSPEPDVVGAFEERFAAMMVGTGLPRMPARVLVALLVAEAGALTAGELVRRLRVSPAAVSKAVGYLERITMVRRERAGRRERYVVDDDVWYRAGLGVVRTCAAWETVGREGAAVLDGSPAAARLTRMSRYFEHVGRDLARSAEHWRSALPS